jgi:hypothetical protein
MFLSSLIIDDSTVRNDKQFMELFGIQSENQLVSEESVNLEEIRPELLLVLYLIFQSKVQNKDSKWCLFFCMNSS